MDSQDLICAHLHSLHNCPHISPPRPRLRRRVPDGRRRRRDSPVSDARVGRAATCAGGVRRVAGRRRSLRRLWRIPVRPGDVPLLAAPSLPSPPELTTPRCLGQAHLLRRR
jgi:hypothetical protein